MNSKPPASPRKTPKKITETYLHNAGLYYLQRFATSSHQFRQVMLRKIRKSSRHHIDQNHDLCMSMLDALVLKFQSAGLLNDEAYTRGVITSLRRQGKSKQAIIAKLKAKGLSGALILDELDGHDSSNSETDSEFRAAIVFARKKKIGPFKIDEKISTEKALSVMARAGFSYDTARRVLNMEIENTETLIQL